MKLSHLEKNWPPTEAEIERFWAQTALGAHGDPGARRSLKLDAQGYGWFYWRGAKVRAHRFSFALVRGPSFGLLDHTCHNGAGCFLGNACPHRACVQESHLEETSNRDNVLRGECFSARNARKLTCPVGHLLRPRQPGGSLGARLHRECRECRAEERRRYNQAHPEKKAEERRRYNQAHPEKKAESNRRYYQAHPEKKAEERRRYNQAHPEKKAEARRRYNQRHPDAVAEASRRYRQSHPEKKAESNRRYYQKRLEKRVAA